METAIVLGVFAIFMLGILDLGIAVLRHNVLEAACRQVAREAAVHGQLAPRQVSNWGPTTLRTRANENSDIAATVRSSLVTIDPRHVRIMVAWPDGDHRPGQRVRVDLDYQHRSVWPMIYGRTLDLHAGCVMRISH